MAQAASVLCVSIIVAGLVAPATLVHGSAPAATDAARDTPATDQRIEAVLLRPQQIDTAALLDGLKLRSPERVVAGPPWPQDSRARYALYAVATVRLEGEAVQVTVVLSDGRAYYRTLAASADGAPRLAASTIANLLAAIEEDELVADEQDVPLPPEREPEPKPDEPDPKPKPEPKPDLEVELPPEPDPLELEVLATGGVSLALGPPAPAGFGGGGGALGADLRWPTGPMISIAVRSLWHRPGDLVIGRTRVSVGGGYAWRRGRFDLRTALALDVEPWGVRSGGTRERVGYPDGQRRSLGLQLGGHLRVVPAFVAQLSEAVALRIGPRLEVGGSALGQAAGIARLVVAAEDGTRTAIARVGGLELYGGLEVGLAWALRRRKRPATNASGAP